MFNYSEFFDDAQASDSAESADKPSKSRLPQTPSEPQSFGYDFNADLAKEEERAEEEKQRTMGEQKKYEETQRHVQEQNIKKIYRKVGRRRGKEKQVKIKNVRRMNKQNLKQKYTDKFLGKVNSYKKRYFANGFSKILYLDKYKKQQDKLDMEANFRIDLEELNRQNDIGRVDQTSRSPRKTSSTK